jgi:hypothetical protein
MMMRNYVNRFANSSVRHVRFNSGATGSKGGSKGGSGGGGRRPAGPEVLIPLFVGYYLIFKPLEN